MENIKNIKITDTELPYRTKLALLRAGFVLLEEVLEKSEEDLLALRNFGRWSLRQLRVVLRNHGVALKEKRTAFVLEFGPTNILAIDGEPKESGFSPCQVIASGSDVQHVVTDCKKKGYTVFAKQWVKI